MCWSIEGPTNVDTAVAHPPAMTDSWKHSGYEQHRATMIMLRPNRPSLYQ